MNSLKDRDWAIMRLHQIEPSSFLCEMREKYFFTSEKDSVASMEKLADKSGVVLSFLSNSRKGGIIVLGSALSKILKKVVSS